MVSATILLDEFFDEHKPGFFFLKNLEVKKNLCKNFRLKNPILDGRPFFSSDLTFLVEDGPEINGFENECLQKDKNLFIVPASNNNKKSIKFFNIDFFQKKPKKISLKKEFLFPNAVTCTESLEMNMENFKFRKNYTAIGTQYNGINIWDTFRITEDEPLCILKDNAIQPKKHFAPGKNSTNKIGSKTTFSSCLKWNLESIDHILEGLSDGCLNYWNLTKGQKIFVLQPNELPISSLSWRNLNRNEFLYLSGNYLSCFTDIRSPTVNFIEIFDKEIKGIQWLSCENLYTVVETSGLIHLKDIRFQRGYLFSKTIHQHNVNNYVDYFQFSPQKKNLMMVDNEKNLHIFNFHEQMTKKISSEKIKDSFTKDFFWLESDNKESLLMIDNNSDFSVFNN